eukprot:scaffold139743_cov55-Attheya_sp.AAC.1
MAGERSRSTRAAPDWTKEAMVEAARGLESDLPLCMYGSGDVAPANAGTTDDGVNAASVQLLAELTATYIANLVDAAVSAHDIQTDGRGGILPPPPPPHHRRPHPPAPYDDSRPFDSNKNNTSVVRTKKRPRPQDDCWDEPLPEPKLKSEIKEEAAVAAAAVAGTEGSSVGVDEWVGVAGVDLYERSRSRKAYASLPSTIGTQCFIFPICHDAALYGRVMEVQAARRHIAPVLLDPVWMDVIRGSSSMLEGTKDDLGRQGLDASAAAAIAGIMGPEGGMGGIPGDLPVWPGLEHILPTHRSSSNSNQS